jgi:hypothetical protein
MYHLLADAIKDKVDWTFHFLECCQSQTIVTAPGHFSVFDQLQVS